MNAFTGTWRLVRLALRRDRIKLPVTMLLAISMVAGSAPALVGQYKTQEEILTYIVSSAPSVVGRVFQGTVQGPTLGSILMGEVFITSTVIIGIMSIFIVSRHTRHNEETGAGELIGSTIVGRSAPLTAALLVGVGTNVLTGFLIFAGLASVPEFDTTGSAYLAVSLAAFGVLFTAVSAATSQLSDYRRGANLMALSVLGIFFVVRAFGDALGEVTADGLSVVASWITWLSPMGWSYQVLPYAENRLFPIVMLLGISMLAVVLAYFLMSRRDIGSSIFATKPGPARAKASLLSADGLARRLQSGNLLAWTIGFIIAGVITAVIVDDFRQTFEENEVFAEWIANSSATGNFVDSIIATMFPLLAAMLAGYAVSALSKMQDEEASGRIEYILGTALGKIKWLFSHVGYTSTGIVVALGSMGAAGGIGYALAAENAEISGFEIFTSAAMSIPAMLLFMSTIVLVFAMAGRFVRAFAWSFYAYCALIGSLAGIFSWPEWVSYLSPFDHTPLYPSNDFDWLPLAIMSGLTIGLLAVSAWLFDRRDLALR